MQVITGLAAPGALPCHHGLGCCRAASSCSALARVTAAGGDGKERESLRTRLGKYYYVERCLVSHCGPKGERDKDEYFQELQARGWLLYFR
jgi:hypothetical protein